MADRNLRATLPLGVFGWAVDTNDKLPSYRQAPLLLNGAATPSKVVFPILHGIDRATPIRFFGSSRHAAAVSFAFGIWGV